MFVVHSPVASSSSSKVMKCIGMNSSVQQYGSACRYETYGWKTHAMPQRAWYLTQGNLRDTTGLSPTCMMPSRGWNARPAKGLSAFCLLY